MAKTKTIDDFKGTTAHKKYYDLCNKSAKERKNRSFFAINGLKK
jgi:hypothetical protein